MDSNRSDYNEQIVVGSLLYNKGLRDNYSLKLHPEDFAVLNNKNFIYAIVKCVHDKMTFNKDTIMQLCADYTEGAESPHTYYDELLKLGTEQNINSKALDYYLERVKSRTVFTSIIQEDISKVNTLISAGNNDLLELDKLLVSARTKIVLSTAGGSGGYSVIKNIVGDWEKEIEDRKKFKSFIPTGYSHVDHFLTEGLLPGKVSIIAGRPGSGKSSFVDNIMSRIAVMSRYAENFKKTGLAKDTSSAISAYVLKEPVYCALCALEMNKIGTLDRLMSIGTGIELRNLIKHLNVLDTADWATVENYKNFYKRCGYLYIDDTPRQSLDMVAQRAATLRSALPGKPIVLFIDLFGRIEDTTEEVKNSVASAYENSLRKVQILAKELNIHFCLVAQIGRAAESVKDKKDKSKIDNRPSIRHLKNSGAFEEIADLIFLLYRQKYYQPDLPLDICEINIAKQRQGIMNKVINTVFVGETTTMLTTSHRESYQDKLNVCTKDDFSDVRMFEYELPPEEVLTQNE